MEMGSEIFKAEKILASGEHSDVYGLCSKGRVWVLKCAKNRIDWRGDYKAFNAFMQYVPKNIYAPQSGGYFENVEVEYNGQVYMYQCAVSMNYIDGKKIAKNFADTDDKNFIKPNYQAMDALNLVYGLVPAIAHYNQKNYYHMDIIKENLIIDNKGKVWLIDYTGAKHDKSIFFVLSFKEHYDPKKTPAYHQFLLLGELFQDIAEGEQCFNIKNSFLAVQNDYTNNREENIYQFFKNLRSRLFEKGVNWNMKGYM